MQNGETRPLKLHTDATINSYHAGILPFLSRTSAHMANAQARHNPLQARSSRPRVVGRAIASGAGNGWARLGWVGVSGARVAHGEIGWRVWGFGLFGALA